MDDADTMYIWWIPHDSVERQEAITEGILACEVMLYGRLTYEMLAPYWSAQRTDEHGPAAKLNSVRKYVVSSSLKQADWKPSTILTGSGKRFWKSEMPLTKLKLVFKPIRTNNSEETVLPHTCNERIFR